VSSATITGIKIWYTKTRANNRKNPFDEPANTDGHWGLVYCECLPPGLCPHCPTAAWPAGGEQQEPVA
jgi:hypothetical protein